MLLEETSFSPPSQRAKVNIIWFLRPFTVSLLHNNAEVEKEEVDRVAADCVHMVEAHDKLKNVHQHELPEIVDKVRKQIADLQNFLSVNQTEHKK